MLFVLLYNGALLLREHMSSKIVAKKSTLAQIGATSSTGKITKQMLINNILSGSY